MPVVITMISSIHNFRITFVFLFLKQNNSIGAGIWVIVTASICVILFVLIIVSYLYNERRKRRRHHHNQQQQQQNSDADPQKLLDSSN